MSPGSTDRFAIMRSELFLEGQAFPRCGFCNAETSWVFIRAAKTRSKQATAPERSS